MIRTIKYLSLILFLLNISKVLSQKDSRNINDSILINRLLENDFQAYIGKNVCNVLLDDNVRCYEYISFDTPRPFILSGIVISLSNDVYLIVSIDEFKYLNRFDTNDNWDKENPSLL